MTSASSDSHPSEHGPPGLDLCRLARYLRTEGVIDTDARLTAELIPGGKSNLTYELAAGDSTWVLRRPPLGRALPTAHDMRREHTVMRALDGSPVPIPQVLLLCTDESVLGAHFYLMEHVPGVVLRDPALLDARGPDRVRALVMETVEVLVRLHAVDRVAVGLADFGRPDGFARRQVERWRRQLDESRTRDIDGIDELHDRLARTVPKDGDASIVHGDYRLDNVIVGPDGDVKAVLDWELSTVGDPLADLALMLTYAEREVVSAAGRSRSPASVAGHPTVAEMADRYGAASGRDLTRLAWYRSFAAFKLAVILEGVYARYLRGQTVGPGFDHVAGRVQPLVHQGLALIGQR
jgi:aminoglycoside phosphotransferase (APT) family kinase protein